MNIRIENAQLSGTVRAIPSKSFAHRMLICAALSENTSQIVCPAISADIAATARCMDGLCARVVRTECGYTVTPAKPRKTAHIDCGESGSTFRFILPIACALGIETEFSLHGRLSERPMQPLYDVLEQNGIRIAGKGTDRVRVCGKLTAGVYRIPADISSQFISGLLFALPLLAGNSEIVLSGERASAAYIAITRTVLAQFGVASTECAFGYTVQGNQRYIAPRKLKVEGDWSNAAFWLCAGALGKQPITCNGLTVDSVQGDRAIVEILRRFGANITMTQDSVTVSGQALHGITVDAEQIPDLVPVLAAVATAASGETRFYHAERLREKESDRIMTTVKTLRALGADITETADGMIVRKSVLHGGTVDSFGDHRIAMMAAIAAVRATETITILGAQAVEKSYPAFFGDYALLGGIGKEV